MGHLGQVEASEAVEDAATSVLPELSSMGGPDMGMSTAEIGDVVAARIAG